MKFHLPSFYLFPIPIKPLLPPAMSFLACALRIISPIPWSRREASKQPCGAWLPGRVKPPHTSTSLTGEVNCKNIQQATQPHHHHHHSIIKIKFITVVVLACITANLKYKKPSALLQFFQKKELSFTAFISDLQKNIDGVACKTSGSLLLPLILAQQIHQHQLTP